MTRWNDTITLLSVPSPYQDAGGAWHDGKREPKELFCNRLTMSLSQTASALDLGMRDVLQVQVRTVDYDGEDQAQYDGKTLEVTYAARRGDTTTLTLGRKIGDEVNE